MAAGPIRSLEMLGLTIGVPVGAGLTNRLGELRYASVYPVLIVILAYALKRRVKNRTVHFNSKITVGP